MRNYKIGICDKDELYVGAFMDYINSNSRIPMKAYAFSNVLAIDEFLANNSIDLILVSEDIELKNDAIKCITLTQKKNANEEYVFKYQNIKTLAGKIIKIIDRMYSEKTLENSAIGVYSPLGRCGKTTLAKGIAKYYDQSIYIGFEEYSGEANCGIGEEEYSGLYDEFIFYLTNQNKNILNIIDKFKEIYNTDYIPGGINFSDLRTISADNIRWLIELLFESGRYKHIVFDMGIGCMKNIETVFAVDKLVVPVLDDVKSKEKLERFKKLYTRPEYQNTCKKILYVNVPDTSYEDMQIMNLIVEGDI